MCIPVEFRSIPTMEKVFQHLDRKYNAGKDIQIIVFQMVK